jgi:hypothetical protein
MTNIQQRYEMLSSSKVGMEFEFFTELTPQMVCKSLSKYLGKKIIVPVKIKNLGREEKGQYHSELEPTAVMFKLERDFSGGKDMYEMITGPLAYEEARIIIIKTLQWIKENGWTDKKCAIHLNVSFNEFRSKLREPLINLNVLKFILGFDEEFIYSRFPNRRDSVYAKSIYNFYPQSRFIFFENPENIDKNDYILPHEKYYGVNFTKLPKNYLELRYLGGAQYETQTYKILEVLDYFISQLYSTLQQGDSYTPLEKEKLFKILKPQKNAVRTFSDPEKFLLTYPELSVTVDMKGDIEILKAFWTVLRDKLFSLIVDSGLTKGHFNLDNDVSVAQLRNGVMKKANNVENLELFDCEISGTIYQCDLYRCTVKSSRLSKCKLLEVCELTNSRLENTSVMPGNVLTDCYVSNPLEIIDGKMIGGVIRRGIIGKNAQISKSTLIINAQGSSKGTDKKDSESYMDAFTKNNKQ